MKIILFLIILVYIPVDLASQDTISLQYCLQKARENHPRSPDLQLFDQIYQNDIQKLETNWYPSLELNGRASYQSDVIEFGDIPMQGIDLPSPSKDQYKLTLDLNQKIYDAGVTSRKKEVSEAETKAALAELEAELWKEQETVIDLFYQYLILQENKHILRLSIRELEANEDVVRSAVDKGVSIKTDLRMLQIQKLELQQDLENLESSAASLLAVLSDKIGAELSPADSFILTGLQVPQVQEIKRKELDLLDARRKTMERSSDLLTSQRLPVVFAFGQLGYGNPGLNMIRDEFDSWYIVGAGLRWNIWDWNTVEREKENISLRMQMLEHQKQDLREKFTSALTRQMTEINNHRENIDEYRKLLEMRKEITATYQSMLDNGNIKVIDYLKVLNDERRMEVKLSAEHVLLQKSIAEYMFINGSLIHN